VAKELLARRKRVGTEDAWEKVKSAPVAQNKHCELNPRQHVVFIHSSQLDGKFSAHRSDFPRNCYFSREHLANWPMTRYQEAEVGKVTFKSNGDEVVSDESLKK
jgi:hypothetical protein